MAGGSNAPFSGEFNDLENVPTLPEGVTTSEAVGMTQQERSVQNDQQASIGRLEFQQNLAELDYDGGFFDIFRDTKKISSTDTTETVQEVDGFEDGDFKSSPVWSEELSNGTVNVQTNTVIKGSQSLELSTSGNGAEGIFHDRGSDDSISDGDIYQTWIREGSTGQLARYGLTNTNGDLNGNDGVLIQMRDSDNGFNLITYDGSGSFIANNTFASGSYSVDTWFRVEIDFDVTNSQVTATAYDVDGNFLGSVSQNYSGTSNIQYVGANNSDGSSGTAFFDDISFSGTSTEEYVISSSLDTSNVSVSTLTDGDTSGKVELSKSNGNFADSGNVTHTVKDLSKDGFTNPPKNIVLSQSGNIPTNTDVSYTVSDTNGNNVTITQSDVDTVVDTSNFTGTKIQVTQNLSQSTPNDDKTPELDDVMVHFKEEV